MPAIAATAASGASELQRTSAAALTAPVTRTRTGTASPAAAIARDGPEAVEAARVGVITRPSPAAYVASAASGRLPSRISQAVHGTRSTPTRTALPCSV